MAGVVLDFAEISMESMGTLAPGRMKITGQEAVFKNTKTGRQIIIKSGDVESCQWTRIANRPALRFLLDSGTLYRFTGFPDADQEKIKSYLKKNWSLDMAVIEPSVRGWNFGTAKFKGESMRFDVESQPAFEIPLQNVSNAQQNKNEVALEFHPNDEASVYLMEMRFHIPDEADGDNVKEFYDNVVAKAGIVQVTGTALVTLKEILCATPRGRYDFKIYPTFIQLRGKSFDYKIPITTIIRLFLLPHKDGRQMFFVISLDPPIKQGQTRYHNLIMEFTKEEESEVTIDLPEDVLKEKYGGTLTKTMEGPLYVLVSRLLKALVNRKITVPGSFSGHSGTPAISCAYKNASGYLYPLERGFMYVHKPPIHVRFEEIQSVNFARSDVSTRSFDFEVETKVGPTYTFTNIEKDEYAKLFDFVSSKKLRIRNMGKRMDQPNYQEADDFGDSDDELDPYKERLKKEAQEREEEEEEENSSEEDEDYNPEADKAKLKKAAKTASGSEAESSDSEPDEEYDSDAASSASGGKAGEGSESGSESGKKKKSSPAKKKDAGGSKRKASVSSRSSGSAAESGTPSPKPAKKKSKSTTSGGAHAGKKEKAVKDPNAPKKPSTAYMIWMNENRDSIKEPGMAVTEVAKKAGQLWKELGDKSKWEAKAKADKERYERQMAEYRKTGQSSAGPSTAKPKAMTKNSMSKSISPVKGAKSKEFVEDSDDSSSDGRAAKAASESGSAASGSDD